MQDYDVSLWLGVLAPAGTPPEVVTRLNREIAEAMAAPDLVSQMNQAGIEIRLSTPQEFGALIRQDLAKWAGVVKRANLQLD